MTVVRNGDEQVVDLAFDGEALIDVGGDGRWDPMTGLGLDGTDQKLDLLPSFTSFPGDYATFFPNGAIWQETGPITIEEPLDG